MSSKVEEDPQKGPWRQGKSQPLANFLQPRKMMCGFCDVRAVQCSLSLVACFCARLESEVKWQGSQITSHKRLHSHTHTRTHAHLSQYYFRQENLPGVTTARAVLEKRASLGIPEAKHHLEKWQPTRLYATTRLCAFCEQLFRPLPEPADAD